MANYAKLSPEGEIGYPGLDDLPAQASVATMPVWLSAMETVAWIVTRDPTIVWLANLEYPRTRRIIETYDAPRHRGVNRLWLELNCEEQAEGAGRTRDDNAIQACRDLVQVAQRGQLRARATFRRTSARQDWEADDWRGVSLEEGDPNGSVLAPHRQRAGGGLEIWAVHDWTDLRFMRDDVLKVWKPREQPAVADADSPPGVSDVPPTTPRPNQHTRTTYSQPAVVAWFREHVAEFKRQEKRPPERLSFLEARGPFPEITRAVIRALREGPDMPDDWKIMGRPKSRR